MNSLKLAQYRADLDRLCGKQPTRPKPLTGIEKEQIEAEETAQFWQAIRKAES